MVITKIQDYLDNNVYRKVLFGGHWSDNPGWLLLTEQDQDITQILDFPDNSVDFLFTEHVIEHIEFLESLKFFKECFRILKPGGIIRTVTPVMDTLVSINLKNQNGQEYIRANVLPMLESEEKELNSIGLSIKEMPNLFSLNSIFYNHGHKFIYDFELLFNIHKNLGFIDVNVCNPGAGKIPENCIERRYRGLWHGRDWKENEAQQGCWDAESGIVEATKPF